MPGLFRRIVMPTDFTLGSQEMLERAVALAVQHHAHLQVFHAALFDGEAGQAEARKAEIFATIERHRKRWQDHPGYGAMTFDYESVDGRSAMDAIDAYLGSARADLVVMATHGGGLLSDSVAEHVVEKASCSVLTARRGAHGRWPMVPGRILVPVDFSDESKAALAVVRSFADACPITLVHVVSEEEQDRETLEARLRAWAGEPVDDVQLGEGHPAKALTEASRADDAALIVVGTHASHTTVERMLGTTAVSLTGTSRVPVLTIR